MYYSVYKRFLHRSIGTPVVLWPAKVTRVEMEKSASVSFGEDGASRGAGRPSEDTVPVNSPDRQMSPPLDLDSTTTTPGNNTMMAHQEVKNAMRSMVSDQDQARRRLIKR